MEFIGRECELALLEKALGRDGQAVALVYGRRRVGKSELVKQYLRNSEIDSIYYECKQTSEPNNVESLAALVSERFGYPKLSFDGIEEVLEFLFAQSRDTPCAVVLDEYPYLRRAVKGLDSIVQSLIDRHRDDSQLKLILCGSFVDVMKSLLEVENPLYGRVDQTVHLQAMDYFDSARFYPDFSPEDKVRLYSVFGGIPHYNRLIDRNLSVRENILELVASPGARLENEVSMYLSSEISKIDNANGALEAMAKGHSKYSDILSQSHATSGPALVDALDKLMRMELVEKRAPINDPGNRRKAGYRIVDSLARFYYRYVFRFASQMSVMDPEAFYDRYLAGDFESAYVPQAFESICRQYLIRQNRRGLLPEIFDQIGTYYYDDPRTRSNGEFDVVTHDALGYVFYEAKFRKAPISASMIEKEIEQVRAAGLDCRRYGFFSRSGFTAEPRPGVTLIDLPQLYE